VREFRAALRDTAKREHLGFVDNMQRAFASHQRLCQALRTMRTWLQAHGLTAPPEFSSLLPCSPMMQGLLSLWLHACKESGIDCAWRPPHKADAHASPVWGG
jgi:hypothetical protein